ncbi:MAG TPA: tRNA (adenosine(37)-N6)-threonylcarbamoyltransferase complex transferase subunit TsaD [bacterium]|nr:tRNA (adenosine(37)-N6)-threonylcarbamoyltransferase complex transferase subunit TsaD [bacterium]
MKSLVLGIESSCDETSVALVEGHRKVLANEVASQMDLHKRYGGVVPEVASRQHLNDLPLLVREALGKAKTTYDDLTGVAVTAAPGLIGALLVGLSAAKGLAFRLRLPLAVVHHIEAHLYAVELDAEPVAFPALGLVVSGGHTELYEMKSWGQYRLLASTRDDAAGEAFDKVSKLMGLGYPGGPILEKLALQAPEARDKFSLSRMKDKSLDFSFSGVKTAVNLELQKSPLKNEADRARLAAKFQRTVLEEIRWRVAEALQELRPKTLLMGGGVACNQALRRALESECRAVGALFRVPPPQYCSDNAAMIAGLGSHHLAQGRTAAFSVTAKASPTGANPFLLQ